MLYEFKITLTDVGVPVSRTIQIEQHVSFVEFHEIIQVAFDWTNSHLFSFFINISNGEPQNNVTITLKESGMFQNFRGGLSLDVGEALLSDWFIQPHDKAMYIYDFGDDWTHEIELVQIIEKVDGVDYPICIALENNTPPEDSRFELLSGEIDLVAENNEQVLVEINEHFEIYKESPESLFLMDGDDLRSHFTFDEPDEDDIFIEEIMEAAKLKNIKKDTNITHSETWEATLAQAKEFLQKKPWEVLGEEDIIVVKTPEENTFLFCKVVGEYGDAFGVEIYFSWEGFFALLESLSGDELILDGTQHERVLLMTYENRTDLEKVEYNLIKAHSTTFRGKKSWPVFISYRPGFFPWEMDEEEAECIRLVMREVLRVAEERAYGKEIPHIVEDEKILLRELDRTKQANPEFVSSIVAVEELIEEEVEDELVLSELEYKRLSKLNKMLPVAIEFTILPLEMPLQNDESERPFYPFISIAVDANSGEVYYHEISEIPITLYSSQQAFLRALDNLGGMPTEVLTDPITARNILPFLDMCDFGFSIEESLEKTENVIEGLMEYMLDQLVDE